MNPTVLSPNCNICTASTFRTKPLPTVGDKHALVNSRKEKEDAPLCLSSLNNVLNVYHNHKCTPNVWFVHSLMLWFACLVLFFFFIVSGFCTQCLWLRPLTCGYCWTVTAAGTWLVKPITLKEPCLFLASGFWLTVRVGHTGEEQVCSNALTVHDSKTKAWLSLCRAGRWEGA